jgi:uncharacterized protein (TIGR03437 family)
VRYLVGVFICFSILGSAVAPAQPLSFQLSKYSPLPPHFGAGAPFTLADFDGDGKLDTAVLSETYTTPNDVQVEVLHGNGDGTFQALANPRPVSLCPAGAIDCSPYYGTQLVAADLNGDGQPDLVVSGSRSTVSVMLGNGDGTLRLAQQIQAPTGLYFVGTAVIADFNGDGKPDIVLATEGGMVLPALQLWTGNGDGTFQAAIDLHLPVSVMGSADFNNDGKLDLLTEDISGNLYTYLANGDGSFRLGWNLAVKSAGYSVAFGDLNGDRKVDFVTCPAYPNTCAAFLGNGDGSFRPVSAAFGNLNIGYEPLAITLADWNGDGKLDLAIGLDILPGNGDGTFQPPVSFGPFLTNATDAPIAVDIDGDGKLDLVANLPQFGVLLNNSPGRAPALTVVSGANSGGAAVPGSLATAYGTNLAATTAVASGGNLPTALGGISLSVRGADGVDRLAQLVYVSPGQINFLVPAGTPADYTGFNVTPPGKTGPGDARSALVSDGNFEIFTADSSPTGVAAAMVETADAAGNVTTYPAYRCSGSSCQAAPIQLSDSTSTYLVLFMTGVPPGFSLSEEVTPAAFLNGDSTSGGISVPVTYFGPQGQFPGLYQLNLRLPNSAHGLGVSRLLFQVLITEWPSLNSNQVLVNIQ